MTQSYFSRQKKWHYICAKVGKQLGLLCRIREDLSANTTNLIYKSFILPILDYCDSVWACCNRGDIDRLERLQNRAARIVMGSRCSSALANLKWDSLEDQRNRHIFKLVNLCLEKKTPQFLHHCFSYNRDIIRRSTRQSNFLYLPKVRTEAAKKLFSTMAALFLTILCVVVTFYNIHDNQCNLSLNYRYFFVYNNFVFVFIFSLFQCSRW